MSATLVPVQKHVGMVKSKKDDLKLKLTAYDSGSGFALVSTKQEVPLVITNRVQDPGL